MKTQTQSLRRLACTVLFGLMIATTSSRAERHANFDVAVYVPVSVVQTFENPGKLQAEWQAIKSQVDVDKVYIEVQRDRNLATDRLLEQVKQFFKDHGVQVAGGMALSDGSLGGQFRSFCYTDPEDRQFIRQAVELAARHFDEIIQDDFFFVTTKSDSDILAKGDRSWTEFRLDLMRQASQELLLRPARVINPRVKQIIKYPNWYEHFQGLGFDLEQQPLLFDGIYTGTETRDPELTDQNLQSYESYLIFRYLENIAPGRNGGGWVDTYSIRYLDRYVEQLWNTVFAKAPEITLFEWSGMLRPARTGDRSNWQNLPTSLDYARMVERFKSRAPADRASEPIYAGVAGYALEQVDGFLGQLGRPIGVASYRPDHAWGEDFLHNYFGMIGIPVELYPRFPTNAQLVLLTEAAAYDPDIVPKIKGQLTGGKTVVMTSGLLRALQGKGIEDVVELQYTDRKILATEYLSGFGPGSGSSLDDDENPGILFPDIRFLTNDSWPIVRALASGRGYPLLLLNRYSRGTLYIWTIPENFNDLYRLPASVTSAIKNYVMTGFPVRLDGPGQVALFAYDNNAFIVESYLHEPVEVSVGLLGNWNGLHNLVTGDRIDREERGRPRGRGSEGADRRSTFKVHLQPHSYCVLSPEREWSGREEPGFTRSKSLVVEKDD